MAQWQNRLNLVDLWELAENKKITIPELGKKIAKRIKKLLEHLRPSDKFLRMEAEEIADDFETVTEDVEEFDGIMGRLYDWADTSLDGKVGGKKVCWVRIF